VCQAASRTRSAARARQGVGGDARPRDDNTAPPAASIPRPPCTAWRSTSSSRAFGHPGVHASGSRVDSPRCSATNRRTAMRSRSGCRRSRALKRQKVPQAQADRAEAANEALRLEHLGTPRRVPECGATMSRTSASPSRGHRHEHPGDGQVGAAGTSRTRSSCTLSDDSAAAPRPPVPREASDEARELGDHPADPVPGRPGGSGRPVAWGARSSKSFTSEV
jgi:hypothetical protein